jgi:hypothetical protein
MGVCPKDGVLTKDGVIPVLAVSVAGIQKPDLRASIHEIAYVGTQLNQFDSCYNFSS